MSRHVRTLPVRLRHALKAGNLTMSDLGRWFDRPIPTVRSWTLGGKTPYDPVNEGPGGLYDRLERLEKAIEAKVDGLPVPPISRRKRIKYLADVKAVVLGKTKLGRPKKKKPVMDSRPQGVRAI